MAALVFTAWQRSLLRRHYAGAIASGLVDTTADGRALSIYPSEDIVVSAGDPVRVATYAAPAPDAPPYIKVGERISVGQVVCIVEAMKLMNEIESEVTGKIVKVMVDNAQPVEFGQVLFLIDPKG